MTPTEAERQYYLSRMGIQLWYARSAVPGAAPTPDLDFSESEAPEEVPDRSSAPVRLPASKGSVKALMQSIDDGKESATPEKPAAQDAPSPREVAGPAAETENKPGMASTAPQESPAETVAASPLDNVSLDMGVWSGKRFTLLSALSGEVSAELQSQLAENILRALGDDDVQHRRLGWPVFNNPRVMRGGGQQLERLLEALRESIIGERRLVCLGALHEEQGTDKALLAHLSSADDRLSGEDPLAALAADPARKRALWTLLQEQVSGVS
ncbi:hypothetical protein [Marinobacter bohaiensis]|uniref:hypothetical protein n=1 Tax=Marinobacter bohaiensis TaxID=2201898 RepID=UPI000DADB4A4|nr:hypothetical protein [Marinobacter bohaiensis]